MLVKVGVVTIATPIFVNRKPPPAWVWKPEKLVMNGGYFQGGWMRGAPPPPKWNPDGVMAAHPMNDVQNTDMNFGTT